MLPEQPKISIVMPAYKSAATIKQALNSLMDQDYKESEIIICLDGEDPAIREAIKCTDLNAKRPVVRVTTIDHAGACAARNAGAKIATGDILAFFSSDFKAHAGMLRKWVTTFKENPDADFVYGGYTFWDAPGQAVYAEPLNPYLLTCYNYIDGGFPLKMEVFREHPWDEQFKSLNDWAFWLDIVLAGHKGVFIQDFTYSAQTPKAGGLSHDSHENWKERVGQIRKKYGIPDRPVCFCSLGYRDQAVQLAQDMGQMYLPNPAFKPHDFKLIYQVGFNIQQADICMSFFQNYGAARLLVHWQPMDVRMLNGINVATLDHLARSFKEHKIVSWACTPSDVSFLNRFGFDARLKQYFAWPDHHVNGNYNNGGHVIWVPPSFAQDIKKGAPDLKFTDNRRLSTVDVIPEKPWGDVMESLQAGKRVISDMPYPGTIHVPQRKTYPEYRSELINTLRRIDKRFVEPIPLVSEQGFRRSLEKLCQK